MSERIRTNVTWKGIAFWYSQINKIMLAWTSKCFNTNKSVYHLDTTCIRLSNMEDGAFNGLYKKYNDTLYIHTSPAKKLILKYGYEDGWNGCHGNEILMDPGCLKFPYRR